MLRLHGIPFDPARITPLLQRAGVVRAFLAGSILTPDFRPDSDIDLVIETDPASPPGLLALGALQMDLSALLGRTVHLTLLAGVPSAQRGQLLRGARMLDAA